MDRRGIDFLIGGVINDVVSDVRGAMDSSAPDSGVSNPLPHEATRCSLSDLVLDDGTNLDEAISVEHLVLMMEEPKFVVEMAHLFSYLIWERKQNREWMKQNGYQEFPIE